jgi:hypothetical protein
VSEPMLDFATSVAAGVVGNLIFVVVTIGVGYIVYLVLRRGALYAFWGLQPIRKIRIYVSHLRVVTGHPKCPEGRIGGAVGPDGKLRSYQGSVVTLLETEMANLMRGLFFASVPGRAIQPEWLKSILLTNADAEVLASPVAGSQIDPEGTVVALGSPGYNLVSRDIENACKSPVRFANDNSAIRLPGNVTITDGRQAVVVRLRCLDRYWFYAAGMSEDGTTAAGYYLATAWRRLHKKYKKIPSFFVVVEIQGTDFRRCRVISEGALYES